LMASACYFAHVGRRWFLVGAAAAFLAAYGYFALPLALEVRRLSGEYPVESLEARLSYEPKRPATRPSEHVSVGRPNEAPELGMQWANSNRYEAEKRNAVLQALHEDRVRLFVNSPGFGIARMIGPLPQQVHRSDEIRDALPLESAEPPQPGKSSPLSAEDLSFDKVRIPAAGGPSSTVTKDELQLVQRATAGDFLNPLGFGYVRDRGHVAGFVSHRMTAYPPKPDSPADGGHWRVEFIDLISLLKHPQPVAYVSKHLPRMDELRNAPTRPLDEFESEHIAKLRAGEEVSFAQGPRRVRMLGAIRAREECLKCHSVDEKTLLGAFSYDLRLDR